MDGGSSDRSVQATNDDATVSKLSCVTHGYFKDEFLPHFVRRPARRSPVIHRGYFARWAALRRLVDQFLEGAGEASPAAPEAREGQAAGRTEAGKSAATSSWPNEGNSGEEGCVMGGTPRGIGGPGGEVGAGAQRVGTEGGCGDGSADKCEPGTGSRPRRGGGDLQIVSLGSGFDTLFFQLKAEGRAPGKFIEVDFPEVTSRKAGIISAKRPLSACLDSWHMAPGLCGLLSCGYALVAADLRDTGALHAALSAAGADFSAPTLLLAECVLIYLDPSSSDNLVRWAARAFPCLAFVTYEQIRPDDSFGQQMIQNLEARGSPLLSLRHTPTLEAKEDRFLSNGFEVAEAVDMDVLYSRFIDASEVQRIEKLEIFDEFEEWHMMQEHYCIAYGLKGTDLPQAGNLKSLGFHIRRRELPAPAPSADTSPGGGVE